MAFYNIFSKKKAKENQNRAKQKIIIDNREKNSLVASELSKQGFEIEFQHLLVGDYLVNNVAIERKALSDLKSSIINKRIFSQMQEIKQYEKYLLIIEGPDENIFNNEIIHENALRGFFLSTVLISKVPVIFTKNEKDTAKYLCILANKKENNEISLRPSKINFSRKEQLQYILEGFPNIGPVKAIALLKKFSSLKNIINAPEQELREILGSRAEEFKKLLE